MSIRQFPATHRHHVYHSIPALFCAIPERPCVASLRGYALSPSRAPGAGRGVGARSRRTSELYP